MLFPVCIELLSWLSVFVHHRFCKPLVRCTYEQARKCLPKIAFPYWSEADFGCNWHRLASKWRYGLHFGKVKIQLSFPAFSNKVRTYNRPYSRSYFGQHRHRETMLWEPEYQHKFQSVCWRIVAFTRKQQGVLRVTRRLFGYCRKVAAARYVLSYSKPFGLLPESLAASCSSEVGQPEYRKRGYRFIPHILFACFSEKHLIPSWLANATTLLPREPVRKEQLLLPSPSISSEYS